MFGFHRPIGRGGVYRVLYYDALGALRFRTGACCPVWISRLSGLTSAIFTLAFLRCGSMAVWIESLVSAFTMTVRLALERLFDTGVRRASVGKELRNAFLILRACERFSQPQIATKNLLEGIVFMVVICQCLFPPDCVHLVASHSAF
jgi:hypothetical protein